MTLKFVSCSQTGMLKKIFLKLTYCYIIICLHSEMTLQATPMDRQKLKQDLDHQIILLQALDDLYKDQIIDFQSLEMHSELRQNFLQIILNEFQEGFDPEEQQKIKEELNLEQFLLQHLTRIYKLQQQSQRLRDGLKKIIQQSDAYPDEILIWEISQLFNETMSSRYQIFEDQRKKHTQAIDINIHQIQPSHIPAEDLNDMKPYFLFGRKKEKSSFYHYANNIVLLIFQNNESLLNLLFKHISEAYINIEHLFQLKGDEYLKYMLKEDAFHLISPEIAMLFEVKTIDPSRTVSWFKRKNRKFPLEFHFLKNTETSSSLSLSFFSSALDYQKIDNPDNALRKRQEELIKKNNNIPFAFETGCYVPTETLESLEEETRLPRSILAALQPSHLRTSHAQSKPKFNPADIKKFWQCIDQEDESSTSKHHDISERTKEFLNQLFSTQETNLLTGWNPPIYWETILNAYTEMNQYFKKKSKLKIQSIPSRCDTFTFLHPKTQIPFVFYKLHSPHGQVFPSTLKRIQKAWIEIGWTLDKITEL